MKLSQLIEELQKFQLPTYDPEVIFWKWDCIYKVEAVTTVEYQDATVIELSGDIWE